MDRRKPSKMCNLQKLEVREEFEDRLDKGYQEFMQQMAGKTEKESHEILMQHASDKEMHSQLSHGLLYAILIEPGNASKHFRDLSFITRDSWNLTLTNVNILLIEFFPKLKPEVITQLLWFFREAIKSNLPKIDNVLLNLLRNVSAGADFGSNVRFTHDVVALLDDNRDWLRSLKPKNSVPMLAVSLVLRAIAIHSTHQNLAELKAREIRLAECIIREKWADCREMLGRDLVLALIRVSRIGELESLWKELMPIQPNDTPNSATVDQMLATFNRAFLIFFPYRLSVNVQRKIDFLTHNVKFKLHDRHVEWFVKQHLSTVEHGMVRADLIRYLCVTQLNPKNVTVQEPVPRWLLISLLMPNTLNPYEQQQCKLTLFWDWLCFDAQSTPVVNLEPAYSLLCHLMQSNNKYMHANTLVDFLLRMTHELLPAIETKVRSSVVQAYRALMEANIACPAHVLFSNSRLDPKVRAHAREVFAELWPAAAETNRPPKTEPAAADKMEDDDEGAAPVSSSGARFSDEEEDSPAPSKSASPAPPPVINLVEDPPERVPRGRRSPTTSDYLSSVDDDEDDEDSRQGQTAGVTDSRQSESNLPEGLQPPFSQHMTELQSASDYDKRSEVLNELAMSIIQQEDDELEAFNAQSEVIAKMLCQTFSKFLNRKRYFPKNPNAETIGRVLSVPLFTLFRATRSSENNDALYTLIRDLAEENNRIGYLLLFYLKSSSHEIAANEQEVVHKAYEDFCDVMEESVSERLIKDLDICAEHDYRLFGHLVPFILNMFKDESQKSPDLLHVIVSAIDSNQLLDIINEIVCENIRLFRKDTFSSFLNASLGWETMEQYFFWQLVAVEDIEWDWVLSVIPKLQHNVHAEAMTNILLMLRRSEKEPLSSLIKQLFCRDPGVTEDLFVVSALRTLVEINLETTAKLVAQQIDKCSSLQDPSRAAVGKEKKANKLSLEQILSHLDRFRQQCLEKRSKTVETFMRQQCMVNAFHSARHVRTRFGELFAVIEIVSQNDRPGRKAKVTANLKTKYLHTDDTDDDDHSNKSRSKKRKVEIHDSDSD